MIACLDVHYLRDTARAAAVVFGRWSDTRPTGGYSVLIHANEAYQPGKFYLRELKPLMAVIERINEPISAYVVDAYCYLSPDKEPGLGAYLYRALQGRAFIVGVAKNRFRSAVHAIEVFRGKSRRPLYITSIGMPQEEAAFCISTMSGKFRIPTLLKMADERARSD
jgi:deoxyribonuclease V